MFFVLIALILSVLFFIAFIIALIRRSKMWKRNLTLWFVSLLAFFVLLLLVPSSNSDEDSRDDNSASVASEVENDSNNNDTQTVIADNEYVTATFERLYDAKNLGVEGVFYIDINAVNKTDTDIWVYLENASVNNEMEPMVMTGTPLYINANKSGRNGFIFSFGPLSIDNIEDVHTVEFDLVVADQKTLAEINRIPAIKLDF